MQKIINFSFLHAKAILLIFAFLLVSGIYAYLKIAKESAPDVPIPIIYVSVYQEGISPQDAERLLLKPLEKELQSIEGLKEISGVTSEGMASVTLEFDAGFSSDKALQDVREQVDIAKSELPDDADEPKVKEINVALFPILSVAISGPIAERKLLSIAKTLKDTIEALPGVLDVVIGGEREEVLDVIVSPSTLETYDISLFDVVNLVQRNNKLIAAGALEENVGKMVLKVPGLIEDKADVYNLPLKVVNEKVIRFKDVGILKYGFKNPKSIARVNGQPALVLEVKKRLGANIINVTKQVRELLNATKSKLPPNVNITFLQDASNQIKMMLSDLQNNVLTSVILVMLIIIGALGVRSAILVGIVIPGAFLTGIALLYLFDVTLNMVVLFSLILVVGMLVDGAIVTIELAARLMSEGKDKRSAYLASATRMAWPITASIATTLVVFIPLLFWPGIVGKFMKYLPITVLVTLSASLFMALIFIPVLGAHLPFAKTKKTDITKQKIKNITILTGFKRFYISFLNSSLNHSGKVIVMTTACFILSYIGYGVYGYGVEFFPNVDSEFFQVQIQARGDLSITEKHKLMLRVEQKIKKNPNIKTTYTKTLATVQGERDLPLDTIGIIQVELKHWRLLQKSNAEIMSDVRQTILEIPGIKSQVRSDKKGPTANKPIEILIKSSSQKNLIQYTQILWKSLAKMPNLIDLESTLPLPGIEWQITINREKAARFGADTFSLGKVVQLVSTGVKMSDYRPDDTDDTVDIRLKFPKEFRHLDQLKQLRLPSNDGSVPIGNFIEFQPVKKVANLYHHTGMPSMTIKADVKNGVLADDEIEKINLLIEKTKKTSDVSVVFKGDKEDQNQTGQFLQRAFLMAIFAMFLILVFQFNKIYQALIILSAIIFSSAGILLGLLVMHQPFSIVMCGLGLIALAGIVVNNNIILIDTFNEFKMKGMISHDAILQTAILRMRPILLTSVTTILGLIPMFFSMTIDLIHRDIAFGAPTTQWWVQLSSSIAGGLTFATILTLVLTPCLLKFFSK